MLDCKILGGRVVDGSGNPWFLADVGIKDGKIAAIGDLRTVDAATTLFLRGRTPYRDQRNPFPHLVVAPGFIDIHSHADYTILAGSQADSFVRQGVTTVVMGNCGFSLAPVSQLNREFVARHLFHRSAVSAAEVEWSSFDGFIKYLTKVPLLTNILTYVGHNTLRTAVMGMKKCSANSDEMEKMRSLLEEALDSGAVGLSAGLEFFPGRAAEPSEMQSLCEVVAQYRRIYAPHIRNRDQFYARAVHEALHIARSTGVKLQIAHLNCRANTGAANTAWDQVVQMVVQAREIEGIDVATDCIPYAWGPGSYLGILPDWFVEMLEVDVSKAVAALDDPDVRMKLWWDSDRYWRFLHRGEWDRVMLSSSKSHPEFVGLTFSEISSRLGKSPWECYLMILCDEAKSEGVFSLHLYGRLFDDEHVIALVTHPLFALSSDAAPLSMAGDLAHVFVNQASYGWTARVLGYYVRELQALSLEEAVAKMTSFPAQRVGLKDRGFLKEGMAADLVIFDPDEVCDITTPDNPAGYPHGIEYVFVNGQCVFEKGSLTGTAPGKVITLK